MNEKEKDMLIKDICARIPYNVVGKCEIYASYDTPFDTIYQTHKFDAVVYGLNEDLLLVTPLIKESDEQTFAEEEVADGVSILDFKPYLFPMSSMTEEQKVIYGDLCYSVIQSLANNMQSELNELINWLNANHFDYRGLIEKGLAIDATGLNIY